MQNKVEPIAKLIGAIIGLARAAEGNTNWPDDTTHHALLSSMHCTLPGMAVEESQIVESYQRLHKEKERLVPRCLTCNKACGRNDNFDMRSLEALDPNPAALKAALLYGLLALEPLLRDYSQHVGFQDALAFLYEGFFFVGRDCEEKQLLAVLMELDTVRGRLIQAKLSMLE